MGVGGHVLAIMLHPRTRRPNSDLPPSPPNDDSLRYDYLFAFDKPSRNRLSNPDSRKKFNAQALKEAYAALLNSADKERKKRRMTRSIFSGVSEWNRSSVFSGFEDILSRSDIFNGVENLARQFLQRITSPVKPKVFGLLDRRAPLLFRQNNFVKISLSQFSIVSTGTTGKKTIFNLFFYI